MIAAKDNSSMRLENPVTSVPGVGQKRAALLAKLNVHTINDLLNMLPSRYLNYSQLVEPATMQPGQGGTIWGTVGKVKARRLPQRQLLIWEAELLTNNGAITLTWFYSTKRPAPAPVEAGMQLTAAGVAVPGRKGLQFVQPYITKTECAPQVGRIWPIYPATAGLSQAVLRQLTTHALPALEHMPEPVPAHLLQKRRLLPLQTALYTLHSPTNMLDIDSARRRMAYGEALLLALAIYRRGQARTKAAPSCHCQPDGPLVRSFLADLPFRLTTAQMEAVAAIRTDMEDSKPMQRLLHGDVGCGKTVVALYAAVKAAENGGQTVMLAPTRLVAEQHYQRWRSTLDRLGISSALVVGASRAARRTATEAAIIFGTHAVFSLPLAKIGLVVVDEQHRFGVAQRAKLAAVGRPHCLYLSATPIPRSLALATWGDLDVTTLADKPPGRTPVDTRWVGPGKRREVYRYVRRQVEAGAQAYIVYPRISDDEAEMLSLSGGNNGASGDAFWPPTVEEAYDRLINGPLAGLKVGLCHGRLPASRIEQVTRQFVTGELQVLVATTIVEVGIDVPKATVMVVEFADQFGLAQLHQLRGRVGRGSQPATCLLVASARTPEATARLNALRETNDGFVVAEQDMLLRGPGEILGMAQSGFSYMQHVELPRDNEILESAIADARELLAHDAHFTQPEHRELQLALQRHYPALGEEAYLCG